MDSDRSADVRTTRTGYRGWRFLESSSQARRIFASREEIRSFAGGTNMPLRKSASA